MPRRLAFLVIALMWCLLPQVGCVSPGQRSDPAALTGSTPATAKEPANLAPAESAKACLKVADTLEKAGKWKDAAGQFELARQHDPKQKQISRRLAVLYDRLGMDAPANAEYQKALEENPRDANLLNNYGYYFYTRNDWKKAEEQFRKALSLDAKHKVACINLARTLAHQERYPESLETFKKVISPAEAFCNMALVLTTQGKLDEAKNSYRQALQLEPGHQRAQAALAKLEASPRPSAQLSAPPGSAHAASVSSPALHSPLGPPMEAAPSPDLSPIEVPPVGQHSQDLAP